ncbi:uncharacterized protein LOC124613634 [Schistocerca americana]|uniref:uncharacterized protein LOC124613634 n=1 Tax=Schistocerca americana TaxID=7009 RepID=UPI001F4F2504|nr:uncharacterized protein LOC124613634 [Schistocerca americana]
MVSWNTELSQAGFSIGFKLSLVGRAGGEKVFGRVDGETHYLSHDTQNELIKLMSKSVINKIINRVKQAKYYAFTLDCTRDSSHREQMSIIIRFCSFSTGEIEGHFIGFIASRETMGGCWDLIKTKLQLTSKPVSETQWESRIGAVKGIFLRFYDVIDSLSDLKYRTDDSKTLSDFEAVLKEMLTFEFIVARHVWYEILLRVNNKKSSYEIEPQLKKKQEHRKKLIFSYEQFYEPIQSAEMKYRDNFFNIMIDTTIFDTKHRFKALNEYFEQFGFIYDMNYLKSLSKDKLRKHCNDLDTIFKKDSSKDTKQLNQYILKNNLEKVHPNLYITIRIMLTVLVSTIYAERSFSKLKLIKKYLRSTMCQQRLSALSALSTETEIAIAEQVISTILITHCPTIKEVKFKVMISG